MRMAELSRRSGVPIASIKYYIREGLLPAGEVTAPNQAEYEDAHLERLSLIRALREAAHLPIATIGRVLETMDGYTRGSVPEYLTIAVGALSEPLEVGDDEVQEYARARDLTTELIDGLGWDVETDSPGRDELDRAVVGIQRYMPGLVTDAEQLLPYARAVSSIAETEIPDDYDPAVDPAAVLRYSVLGTVLFEPVVLGLRKLAHVDRLRRLATSTWRTPSP